MLLRSSRQRLQLRATFQAFLDAEPLHLPFLCPAICRPLSQARTTISQARHPNKTNLKSPRPAIRQSHDDLLLPASRGLASAATIEYEPSQEDFIPFDVPPHLKYQSAPNFGPETIPPLQGFDLSPTPLILDDAPTTASPGNFRSVDAISGDLNIIHQTLHACLQVGRLERAAALVRRLIQIYKPDAPGLLAAYKDYLREVTLTVIRKKDMKLLQDLLSWFEIEIRRCGVSQDAQTFALVIQACMQDPNQKRCARMVRRYYNFARDEGVEEETKELVPEMESVLKNMAWYIQGRSSPLDIDHSGTSSQNAELDYIPDIRQVDVKGQGLITLKKSLSLLDKISPQNLESSTRGISHKLTNEDRQRILEQTTAEAALDRWRIEDRHLKSIGIHSELQEGSPLGAIMWSWHEKLESILKAEQQLAIEAERKTTRTKAEGDRLQWGPYLQSLSAEKLSAVTVLSCMNILAHEGYANGVKVVSILNKIGSAAYEEHCMERGRKDGQFEQWRKLSQGGARTGGQVRRRSPSSSAVRSNKGSDANLEVTTHWPQAIKIQLAALLLSKLIDVARIDVSRQDSKTGRQILESRPVFFHSFHYKAGKRFGIVRLNSAMVEKLSTTPVGSALAKHLPMVCEPKPWVGFREGGFLEHSTKVVRYHEADEHCKRYSEAAAENGDLTQVFAGLDVLGKTPWKINRPVYEVMAQAWNTGEKIAKIPAEKPIFDTPPEPSTQADARERRQWMRKVQEIENEKAGLRSERCFQNFQMEVARAFTHETFYFPHNIDFRGRAYPMAPFLNYMGADNARGLLLFAKGKELGSTGLWWLKVHLANVYGYDKASFTERLHFTEDHMAEIQDSAVRPMNGNRWWLQAEDPWQCLAACMELHNALQSPDPSRFVSHLAIHQDGTCNGLQHYAALGGDMVGARQVNLEPGDRPADIYTGVAEMIKAEIKEEAEKGNPIAKVLDGHITRKVVKQTVMTNVYGVTVVGAQRQVRKQLEDLLPEFPNAPSVSIVRASSYIARKIFKTLASMFTGAHNIQYWFGDCAARICRSISPGQITAIERENTGEKPDTIFKKKQYKSYAKTKLTDFTTPVTWTTPLKLPVVQPYRKETHCRVQTEMQGISLLNVTSSNPIHRAKQLQGFPPNFIHSLDGTHMFLTALRCRELGLTFAAVHDSFWTHAAEVDTMNTVTRDAFIRMHSENIVARLAAEFEARYKGYMHLACINSDSSAAQKVQEWRQKCTRGSSRVASGKTGELLLEVRRLRLLASKDPKERAEGEAMVTPGSIFAAASDQERQTVPDQVPATLGQTRIPSTRRKAEETQPADDIVMAEGAQSPIEDDAIAESKDEEEMADAVASVDGGQGTNGRLNTRPRKKQDPKKKLWLWIPLTFPPVPEKGEFEVRRLKDSPYFFS